MKDGPRANILCFHPHPLSHFNPTYLAKMLTGRYTRKLATSLLCTLAISLGLTVGKVAFAFEDPTPADTVITNRAEGTYQDDSGNDYTTVSPPVSITTLAVPALTVTPDETSPSAVVGPQQRLLRIFRICNTGNVSDNYQITRADVNAPATLVNLYFDNDSSNTVTNADTLLTVNTTLSQAVAPRACLPVLAVVDTNDATVNSLVTIGITARSNLTNGNGQRPQDDGTIINIVDAVADLTSPDNANLPPAKTVNGTAQVIVSPGTPFTYTIAFRNSGLATALGVVVVDDLPSEIDYVAGSLTLDTRSLTDLPDADEGEVQARRMTVRLPQVLPDQVVRISFQAVLNASAPAGVGVVNFANLSAQNAPPVTSSTAVVLVDPFGTVYAGRGGSATPIPGARVEILLDQNGNALLSVPPGVGFPPNLQNENPFLTDGLGHFSFVLLPGQLGSDAVPARYFMRISAPGYSTRMLEVTARPRPAGLFALTVHALDGQPIAVAGGFDLVRNDVLLENLASIAFNIPMFEPHGLEIIKSADRPRAVIGDAVAYRLEVRNPTAGPVSDLVVRDRLPNSFHYVQGSGRLTRGAVLDQPIEPEIAANELVFHLGVLGAGESARLLYRVRIGANASEGEQENVAFAAGLFPGGERAQTPLARAVVIVGSGVFSTRQIILGRVFVDTNRNGTFDSGDKPMPGVRLFLHSGESVVTDSEGMYNFPSLGDGPQVLSLDPITLPSRYSLADGGTLAGRSWARLLRTPLGGGSLLRQNFALEARADGQDDIAADLAVPATTKAAATDPSAAVGSVPSTSIRIAWEQRPGVSRYRVQLATDEAFRDVVFDGAVTTNEYRTDGLAPGRYYWRVAAAKSEAGRFSKPAFIDVKAVASEEFISNETLDPIAPGEVKVLSPANNEVVLTPAMQLDARVALHWTVKLEVNGKVISQKNIGTTREDQKNSLATYSFVGVELRPGPNRVRATAISPTGEAGRAVDLSVMGRGPARRLEIVTEKSEIHANGRDATTLRVRAFDEWGNPAADDQVALETSAGELMRFDAAGAPKESNEETARAIALLKSERTESASHVVVSLAGGEARVRLVASGAPGEARLHAQMGQNEAESRVRIVPESRPTILIGLAEMTVGQSVPEVNLRGEEGKFRSRFSFFYSGRVWKDSLLTFAYDSQRPINRTAGRDRLFQLDPLDRVYPLFGDSSTRYEAAQSNSKVYARLDHNRSYAMFGDFDADMNDLALAGYARKLTGVKLHVENSSGDFITVTGARPDTAFARDVFAAGSLGLMQLSHGEILPGSEAVMLEVRDRRNPEIILSRESLIRSVDYNLNSITGELFFLRYISTFDFNLNLVQLVVTYEHRANSLSTAVYTTRVKKNFRSQGLQLGFGGVMQRQDDSGAFLILGLDGEKQLPHKGLLRFAFARSQGELMGTGNFFENGNSQHDGNALLLELNQPVNFYQGVLRARYSYASAGFLNPFGSTVTAGSRRGEVSFELKPRASTLLHFGLTDERNNTDNVDNRRLTLSAFWNEMIGERIRLHLGFDHRSLDDESAARSTESNLVTVGADIKLTDKLQVAVKREQNLGVADPTFPDQTTIAATYQVNTWAKVFLSQRFAAAAIMPIGDFSGANSGFASSGARHETAIGVETRLGKYSSMTGRYQLENGINGTDSFAVIGLQNRLPLNKELSLELGFERGFHVAGEGEAFNSATVGFGWQPNNDFRASARYEFRDRAGNGQLFALGAAGRISKGITALTRFQMARTDFDGRHGSSTEAMGALAIRPLESDRVGLLFSFNHRSQVQDGGALSAVETRDRLDSLSADGYFQATKRLELYGRVALRFNANGQADLPFTSTLTYLTQERLQYRLSRRFDLAGEMRFMVQPSSHTMRSSYGTEIGFWALADLRVGLGYNFNAAREPEGARVLTPRRGFYFTLTSKLSNLFDLFGTSRSGLANSDKGKDAVAPPQPEHEEEKQ